MDHGFVSVGGNTWCDVCGEKADQHEPEGTFACPICGSESRHSHTSIEIAEYCSKWDSSV
jgi:predicted RNA-binding Zn-ribbon protein involved in translation (DUF1610 family)